MDKGSYTNTVLSLATSFVYANRGRANANANANRCHFHEILWGHTCTTIVRMLVQSCDCW